MQVKYIIYSFTLLVLCAAFTPPATAQTTPAVQAPTVVGIGEPFLVSIDTPSPDVPLSLEWLGKVLELPAGQATHTVLLGSDVKLTDPGEHAIVLSREGTRVLMVPVRVAAKEYPEQRLTVKKKMVNPSSESLDRHWAEKKLVVAALSRVSPYKLYTLPLVRPVSGSLSSVYGLRRFFNDQPRSPHRGVDMRGPNGTPIKATAGGIVALTGNHYFAGGSVYIDHGQGVISMYFHLSHIGVQDGQVVEAGEVIGEVGSTGRVTGPHLHFGVSVLGAMVDPMPLFGDMAP